MVKSRNSIRQRRRTGFTLIELMITLAIVGVLAALAIPAYESFRIRARGTELLLFAAAQKPQILEYYGIRHEMPVLAPIDSPTAYIHQIEFWRARDDRMVIHVYPTTNFWSGINQGTDAILLEAIADSQGNIRWACGPHSTFRHVPERFLPASCRSWIDNQR